jgi:hypothetical protein
MRLCSLAILMATFFLMGCREAIFNLSDDSRLPKFFSIPDGMSRSDLDVRITSYSELDGGGFYEVYALYEKGGFVALKKVTIENIKGPFRIKENNAYYPFYVIVNLDGVIDIAEHRQRNDIIYMVDDPAIWKELGVEQR